jgi:thiamine-phosphate pyrophosphorylase
MTSRDQLRGLYVITDHEIPDFKTLYSITEEILRRGVFAIQYRDKSVNSDERYKHACELQKLCASYGTPFIINDDIDLAEQIGSDGVHLGKDDIDCKAARARLGKTPLIGVSCYNSLQRAAQAVEDGADYIAFGAMFPTQSKANTTQAAPGLITTTKQEYNIAVAAIGGITPENCRPLIEAGADILAVIGSVYRAQDPGAVVDTFNKLMSIE